MLPSVETEWVNSSNKLDTIMSHHMDKAIIAACPGDKCQTIPRELRSLNADNNTIKMYIF